MIFRAKSNDRTSRRNRRASLGALLPLLLSFAALIWTACGPTPQRHYDKAKDLADADRFEEAVVEYEAALEIDPDFAKAHYRLSRLLSKEMDDYEGAIEHMRRVVEIDPRDGKAWKKLSRLHENGNDFDGAIRALENGLAANAFADDPDEEEDLRFRVEELKTEGAKPADNP